jgi:hypothetical protein
MSTGDPGLQQCIPRIFWPGLAGQLKFTVFLIFTGSIYSLPVATKSEGLSFLNRGISFSCRAGPDLAEDYVPE